MAPLTAATLYWYGLAPTGPMPDSVQNDRDPFGGQSNLELLKENKMPN
jgi:hypothetical protein